MGSPEFVATALLSRTETLAQRTNALIASARASPTLAQNHYRLLRFCIASANTYLLRAVKPSAMEDFADNVDALVTSTALELMELPRTATSPDEVRAVHRLQLPVSLGGAGLGSLVRTRFAAYIAGCVSVAPAIKAWRRASASRGSEITRMGVSRWAVASRMGPRSATIRT